jgi:hypothetical protein
LSTLALCNQKAFNRKDRKDREGRKELILIIRSRVAQAQSVALSGVAGRWKRTGDLASDNESKET